MSKFEFTINLAAESDKLIKLATDYQSFVNYLPAQIKSIKILETNNEETVTEEILMFSSFVKGKIAQRSIHKKIAPHELYTEIISGPFKGTVLYALYEKIESGTKITINANLKIPLKYRIISGVIKKYYKHFLTSILYQMNTIVTKSY